MKRVSFIGASALALTPLVARSQELPKVRLGASTQEGVKVVYYAVQSGLFRKAGLDVEIVTMTGGAAAMAAVSGGSIDVAWTSIPPFFEAFARGIPFEIVAPSLLYLSSAPISAFFVARDSPIRRGSDINGKVFGVHSLKDLEWAGACNWIDETGGDSRTVKFVELPAAGMLPPLTAGRIDVGTFAAPYLQQALESSQVRLLSYYMDAIAKRLEISVYIATRQYVDTNRDTMTRFAKAMRDSALYCNTHPEQMIPLIASFTRVSPAVVAKATRTVDPPYVSVRDIQPLLDLSYKYGLIDRRINANELIAPTALRPPGRD